MTKDEMRAEIWRNRGGSWRSDGRGARTAFV